LLEAWLKRFFVGSQDLVTVDYDMWLLNFESLVKSIEEAGLEFTTDYQYAALADELRANAASFAAFKNHDEQEALRNLLTDDDGKPRSWNEFKKAAQPITEKYNKTWLKTEYDQAVASSQMAVKWEGFAANADIYPNLEYRAVGDSKTRPEHAKLDGTILPISDKFWNKYYPPNGWGCRCSVTQTDKEPTKEPEADKPDKGFDFNPGKDKKLFADDNGYQDKVNKKESKKIEKQANEYLDKYLK